MNRGIPQSKSLNGGASKSWRSGLRKKVERRVSRYQISKD